MTFGRIAQHRLMIFCLSAEQLEFAALQMKQLQYILDQHFCNTVLLGEMKMRSDMFFYCASSWLLRRRKPDWVF